MSDREGRSVHGGALPVSERWTRARAHAQVFGTSGETLLGRFALHERIGTGGMGDVYAAWDPKLERRVALKVLRPELDADGGAKRLELEARALAALTHPNVVTVYEVGEDGGEVYIAMELVEGSTLRAWQHSDDRDATAGMQVVRAYREAGLGLAAAHERGIVHGDFKPENALIDAEGRVRVADFGLAASVGTVLEAQDTHDTVATPGGRQTLAGGTPGYMAPELLEGAAPSPASDQYALCVSLFEALHGHRPDQPAGDRPALRAPAYVRRALHRGLRPNPSERFADMHQLVHALEPRRRTWLWASLVGVAAAGATLGLSTALGPEPTPCEGVAPRPWAEGRVSAQHAFAQATTAWIEPTWAHVDAALSRRESLLVQTHEDACRLESRREPAVVLQAKACLAAVWSEHRALTDSLAAGDTAAMRNAALRLPTLLPASACEDDDALRRFVGPQGPELRERLELGLLRYARLPGTTVSVADDDVQAGLHADPLTEAVARTLRARAALEDGELETAAEDLRRSATLAAGAGHPHGQVRALTLLAYALGQDRARLAESEQIARQALDVLDTTSGAPLLRARLLHDLGSATAHARPPDHNAALGLHRESIALLEGVVGAGHPLTVRARLSLGSALARAGDDARALKVLSDVDKEVAALWRADDPTWARSRRALGLALLRHGDAADALQAFDRSAKANAERLGAAHLEVARDHYNAALALRGLSRDDEALERLQGGLVIAQRSLGPEHPELIPWLSLQGRTALALGRTDTAETALRRAIGLCESDGAAPKEFAKLRVFLAEALVLRDPAAARVHLNSAQQFLAKTPGFAGLRSRAEALDLRLTARSQPENAAQSQSR